MPRSFKRDGWRFDAYNHYDEMFDLKVRTGNVEIPFLDSFPYEVVIKHEESGLKFSFHPFDMLFKCRYPESRVPIDTYQTPLQHRRNGRDDVDCPYAGRVSIEEENSEKEFSPIWENVDFGTLCEEIDWTAKNCSVDDIPKGFIYPENKMSEEDDLPIPLVNFAPYVFKCAFNRFSNVKDEYDCFFHLLVTSSGWFFHLCQRFHKFKGLVRLRQMTMHCKFGQDTVYREITETQNKTKDDTMSVLFHETKQFKIQAGIAQRPKKSRRGSNDNVKEVFVEGPEVPETKVKVLLGNGGKIIESIELETETIIQVVPLFSHPLYSKSVKNPLGERSVRRAYMHGLGEGSNIELARDLLLKRMEETTSSTD